VDTLIAQATDAAEPAQKRLRAFEELVRRYQDMAYGYACALLGDTHLAQDAAQEAFIVAWRRLNDVRTAEAFPGWLRRVVHTQCDRMTRGKRLPTAPLEHAADVRSAGLTPGAQAEEAELRAIVSQAVQALPAAERVATTLYYLDGYTRGEIARFLGISPGAVSTRLHSARKRLKGRLLHMVRDEVQGGRPSQDDTFLQDVLFRSIQEGDERKVREVIGSDASLVHAVDGQGRTPIEALTKAEHPGAVRSDFRRKRAIYEFLTRSGGVPDMSVAIAMNDVALVEELIGRHPEQISAQTAPPSPAYGLRRLRMRPLSIAVAFHREEIARILLDAGADVHADRDQAAVIGATAPLSSLQLLIERGAKLDPYPEASYGPLVSACEWLEAESARALLVAGADPSAPVYARFAGDMVERFQGLVPHDGPDAPEEFPMEWLRPSARPTTPLFIALGTPAGYCVDWDTLPRTVEVLLNHGADAGQEGLIVVEGSRMTMTPLAYLRSLTEGIAEAETSLRAREDQAPHNLSSPGNRAFVEETAALLRSHGATE